VELFVVIDWCQDALTMQVAKLVGNAIVAVGLFGIAGVVDIQIDTK
jgi:hypothetical protein